MSTLAIDGGARVHSGHWPGWPPNTEEVWKTQFEPQLRGVFLSRNEGLPHARGKQFAKAFCQFLGAKYGLLTTSGTSALKLALCAVTGTDGLGDSGEAIVPNYTFIASASAALEMGFTVRFADVDYETTCLDPRSLEAAITPKTRVIIAVDLFGHPADIDAITAIAKRHDLKVIQDTCQAHGAEYQGRKCGSLGDAGCFSFQSTKNLTSGEGGFVATNSEAVFQGAYAIHNVGRAPEEAPFHEARVGYNYRASEYLAALLEQRLKELPAQMARRDAGAAYLSEQLKGITGLRPAKVADYCTQHAWHLYGMRYTPSAFGGHPRDEFVKALSAEGVPCGVAYGELLSRHGGIQAVKKRHPELVSEVPCPNTERLCKDSVLFTQNVLLADQKDLADIPEAVRKIQKAWHS